MNFHDPVNVPNIHNAHRREARISPYASHLEGLASDIARGLPSLRHLKAVLAVVQAGTVTGGASQLGRSQTALTKSIAEIEKALGLSLFDRSSSGVIPTVYGTLLARRTQFAMEEFAKAGRAYLEKIPSNQRATLTPIFSMDVSNRRLAAFISLSIHENTQSAATALGVTSNAIHKSIKELEAQLGCELFIRSSNSHVAPTPFCSILAQHVRSAFAEVRIALSELESVGGVLKGEISIGTLPFLRTAVLPRAIERFLVQHPGVLLSTKEGDLDELVHKLRAGEVECIAGVSREMGQHPDLATEELFTDELVVVAREGHPLSRKAAISLPEIAEQSWVLKPASSPSSTFFRNVLEEHGLACPSSVVETVSLSLTRGILLESDRLAFASRAQTASWRPGDKLVRLNIDLSALSRRYSPKLKVRVLRRANSTPSPSCRAFIEALAQVAATVT